MSYKLQVTRKKLVIIDGNAIIHRAYHAIPPLTDKDGRMVNAVYGFTSMLLKVWSQLEPEYLVATFDMAGKTFRHAKFEKYKATRVKADQELYDQIPLVHNIVEAFNIPIWEKAGYEADDLIGTIAKQVSGVETYIVTGDMDTLQLVNNHTKVYTMRKGMSDIVIYDPDQVKKRFGFGPEMVVDYKALRGDASDNIPGIRGIGEKGATELILKIGGIDDIYKALSLKPKTLSDFKPNLIKKLIEGKKDAEMSKELATIDCDVPDVNFNLEECRLKDFDHDKVLKILQKFEFTSLVKRIPGMDSSQYQNQNSQFHISNLKIVELKKDSEVKNLVKNIRQNKTFACKEIIKGRNILDGEFQGLVFVVGDNGFWIKDNLVNNILEIFTDPKLELVGHNLKELIKTVLVLNKDLEIKNDIFDVQIASYLLNPGTRTHNISSIILKILGKSLPIGSNQESLFGVDTKVVADELFLLSQCVDKLKKELDKTNNLGLAEKIEMPLMKVLAKMELNGVAVDGKKLSELSKQVAIDIEKITAKIYKYAGEEFNIASTTQLRDILFEKLELPADGIKKGKTGYSTNSAQLEKLRDIHPIIGEIENFRELTKLQNTYIDILPKLVNEKTGRIHTTFNQTVTATGRLSSSEPNLQNIPIRTVQGREIRKAFIAESGNSLVVADYSQIELRIVASLAKDKKMMEIFNKDLDIHKATASFINGVKLEDVTKEMRSAAKAVNFGVLYGMGSYGLSARTGLAVWEAKDFIKKYFEQFSDVKKYLDQTLKFTKQEGYCETLFGRRRYLPELNSPNFQVRSGAERMAINHPVQGTAADVIKMAMIEISHKLEAVSLKSKVKLILQVHDELVLEVKKGLEEEVSKMVKKTMEDVVKLNVPVRVDVDWGERWGEIK